MMIRRAQSIGPHCKPHEGRPRPKHVGLSSHIYIAMLVVQFTSAHLPTLKAMQVFRIWISAQRTQLSTFILTRYPYNTSLTKMSPRQDRLADGPFKLIETPIYAQKSTVSVPIPFSYILLRDKPEAV
jgi:hypothetical protein